jgi:hypothetical protein
MALELRVLLAQVANELDTDPHATDYYAPLIAQIREALREPVICPACGADYAEAEAKNERLAKR